MPPRYSYWTILAGGLPTAFRAADREELEPTFKRLRDKHPDAEMKWFARGKLWASPEAAREASQRERPRGGFGERRRPDERGEARGRDWRPGGEHRDPRQKFKDAKKAKNLDRRQAKFARKHGDGGTGRAAPGAKPRGDTLRPRGQGARTGARPPREDWRDRPPREKPHGDKVRPGGRRFSEGSRFPSGPAHGEGRGAPRDKRDWRPSAPSGPWRNRPPLRTPQGDAPGERAPRGDRFENRSPGAPRGEWRDRPPRESQRDRSGGWRPGGQRQDTQRPRGDWRDRPAAGKPQGDKLGAGPARDQRQDSKRPRGDWRNQGPRERPHGDKPGAGRAEARRPDGERPRGNWRDRSPRGKPHGNPLARGQRPFDRKTFPRGQNVPEPPPRPRGPNREPRPGESPQPTPPPRPSEPVVPPPGPPERGGPIKPRQRRG